MKPAWSGKAAPLIFCLFFIQAVFSVHSPLLAKENRFPAFCLLIIDFDDFSCFSCLDSFMRFVRFLPGQVRNTSVWGVIVYDTPEKGRSREKIGRIVEAKLRGFKKANEIDFPILVDHQCFFRSICSGGNAVFVFSRTDLMLRRFPFPLKSEQMEEILNLLTGQAFSS